MCSLTLQDDPKDNSLALLMMLDKVGDKDRELPNIESGLAEDNKLHPVTKYLANMFNNCSFLGRLVTCVTIQVQGGISRTWVRCHYQQNYTHMPQEECLCPEDCQAVRGLLTVLKPLEVATLAMLKADIPLLADWGPKGRVPRSTGVSNDQKLPLYLHHTANCAQSVLNQHYMQTDNSSLYQLTLHNAAPVNSNMDCMLSKLDKEETAIVLLVDAFVHAASAPHSTHLPGGTGSMQLETRRMDSSKWHWMS
ncbi:hypothetical protein BDV93DRAFT_515266 [Ceratobasidium sp. AG-I]|nr:hypothetical protein BDV93DRAFT_515266 [Ceratobasidium sp. AG-I]